MAVNLDKIKKHEQYKEGYRGSWNTKEQNNNSTWNQVQNIANDSLNRFNRLQVIENYNNAKRASMQAISNQLQEKAKAKKEQEEQSKLIIDQLNKQFNQQYPSTVNPNQEKKDYKYKYEIPSQTISNQENLKQMTSEELLQMTNGTVDVRNGVEKAIDSVTGIGGNIAMGIESVVPSISNYINTAGEVATEMAGNYLSKSLLGTDDEASKILGEQVFGKLWGTTDIAKANKELNSEELQKWRKETINKNITKTYLGKEIAKVAPSVGQNIIPMAISYFNPIAGSALFMTSAAGSYLDDAEERGMNKEQSLAYATVMGGFEGITEKVITGEMASNAMKIFGGVGLSEETLKGYGVTTVENFFQEALMEPLQETTASLIGGKDKANWSDIEKRMVESGASGVLSSILLNGASAGIASASNVLNKSNPTEAEIQTALADTINSKKVNIKDIIEGAKEAIKSKLNENVTNNTQQQTTQVNNTQNITQEQTPLTQNVQQQNSIEEQNNENISNFMQSAQNEQTDVQKYQYEKSDNVKIDNLRQDANRFFDNSEQAHNYINMLEQIVQDKDVDIRFDNTLTDENGNMVNGRYKDGVITINPNSTRTGEFIAIHELTHAIGTKDMIDIVENYRKSNAEFDTAVQDLLKSYNQTEITEEALADVSAQLFGNQEFINNLSQTNPSVFKKIYNEIKYLWHQFRGYKNQNQFIEDLQYKWEQAYRNNNELNNTTNYYIEPVANFDEVQYNNIQGLKLNNKEDYALREIVNSDSNVKPGINRVETTNATYTIYYKGIDDFKVMTRKVDKNAGKLNKRNDYSRGKTRYSRTYSEFNGNEISTRNNDEISNINSQGENKRIGSTTSSTENIRNGELDKTSSFSLQKDNQGRQLTKEQQDYFRDSKVRDSKGNLLTVYHGTTSEFNVFNYNKLGENTSSLGAGFYFTDQKATGQEYTRGSGNLKEVYLDIKKPMGYMETLMTKSEYQKFIEAVNKETNGNYLADYDGLDNALMEYEYGGDDIDLVNTVHEASGLSWEKTYELLKETTGFDGIISKEGFLNNGEKIYVAFNPNQIKNINNTTPTNNPDIRYSKQNENWQEYLDNNFKAEGTRTNLQDINLPTKEKIQKSNQTLNLPTKETIKSNTTQQAPNLPISENMKQRKQLNNITNMEEPNIKTAPMDKGKLEETKIAKILTEPMKKQKPQQRAWALFTANLIDKGSVFETLSLKTNNRELQAKYDATLSSGAKGQYAIGNDRYIFENGKKTLQSKSLTSIIDEVGDKVGDFQEYMYHQLNIDRMTLEERFGGDTGINYERKDTIKNKPVFGNDIDAEYSREIVEEYENKYPEFKSYAQDVYDYLDANKKELVDTGVIPQELSDKFKEMYPHYVPIARIDKNNNSIQVPLDTQRTGVNTPIKRAKGGSQDIQPLFHTIADKTMQTYKASARNAFGVELKHTLEQNGLLNSANEYTDIDTIIDTMTDEQQTGLTEGTKYSNPTFTVFENGEKVTYEINQDMYDALKPQSEKITKFNNTKPSKVLNTISNIRRGVLTEYNPLFSITNALKDAQDVVGNSQHATKTFSKFPEAYAQIVKKGYWYNEYIQNGGEQNSYFKDGEFELENNKSKAKKVISMPLEAISKVNNVIEMAPRLSEYIASREQGRSIETSMLDAARVTTNFKAGGDITKALNRNGATFLNAGVQGMAQQVRNIREANAKGLKGWAVLLGKWAVMGAPAILLNHFIWGDDDDYDELQDYVKDNYYVVGKTGDNQFIRIPKGRTTAVIQKLVSNVDQYVSKDKELNWDNFAEDFWGMLSFTADNVAPNNPIDNNVVSPIVQVAQNKSWYGEDIVPSRLQDVPEAEQYDETTDEFSKWVGKILNISPMKVNYLLDQYGGGVSDALLPLGTPQAENNPIEDKFTTNSIIKNKNPGEFYDKLDKLKVKSNSLKSTDEDTLKYKYMSGINEEMSKLYKQKREEQNSSDDDKTKKQKVQNIQNQINELAKKGLNDVDNFKINTTTATVGNEKYYKNISVKTGTESWEKLSKEEIEKNKNISLETYASFKRKVAQETIAKRKSGELKEEQQLKNVDKTKIILDSNCSDEEKLEVYKKYIGTEDKKVQLIDKLGFPIKGYLNYKTYNFESDKDEEGESVSGTKKTKVVNYLKSIPDSELSLEYKHIIAKIENISEFDNDIVKFIDNRDNLTKDEKKELLEIIGFKVDKNGYVQTTSMIPIRKYIK